MKNLSLFLVSMLVLCLSCNTQKDELTVAKTTIEEVPEKDTSIDRGKYLVTLMDCNTCHTPMKLTETGPVPDMTRMLSGYPSDRPLPKFDKGVIRNGLVFYYPDLTSTAGPWGVSFGANLTPDDTGIGTWSLDQFKTAMRKGKLKGLEGSRDLLLPMPWRSYANLTDADVEAIYNYLKSIPAIENIVPGPIMNNVK